MVALLKIDRTEKKNYALPFVLNLAISSSPHLSWIRRSHPQHHLITLFPFVLNFTAQHSQVKKNSSPFYYPNPKFSKIFNEERLLTYVGYARYLFQFVMFPLSCYLFLWCNFSSSPLTPLFFLLSFMSCSFFFLFFFLLSFLFLESGISH